MGCKKKKSLRDFLSSPVAKTRHSQCRWPGSIPGQGNRSCMPQLRLYTAKQIKTLKTNKQTHAPLNFLAFQPMTWSQKHPLRLVLDVQSPGSPLERGHCSLYTVDLSVSTCVLDTGRHTHHIFYTSVHLYATYLC